jgi:hypothetical protein
MPVPAANINNDSKWKVNLNHNGKHIYIGFYNSHEEAAEALWLAKRQYSLPQDKSNQLQQQQQPNDENKCDDSNATFSIEFPVRRRAVLPPPSQHPSAANKTLTECFVSTKGKSIFKSSISSDGQRKVKNDFLLALYDFECLNKEVHSRGTIGDSAEKHHAIREILASCIQEKRHADSFNTFIEHLENHKSEQ